MPQRTIEILPYDAMWPRAFESVKAFLLPALAPYARAIEHVGGTSVPGLWAKPILDVDVALNRSSDFEGAKAALERLGCVHKGDLGIAGREAFALPQRDDLPACDLYVCPPDSAELARHLALRDYLRAHGDARDAYGEIKRLAAARCPHDIDGYLALKGPFIEAIYQVCGLLPKPASTEGELWDLYDPYRKPLSRTMARGEKVPEDAFHIVVEVWTFTPKGELLLTLRDPGKRGYPNTWENTGGALQAGENSRQGAARELFEETGLTALPCQLRPLASNARNGGIVDSYLVVLDFSLDDIMLQRGETVFARLVTLARFEKLVAQGRIAEPIQWKWASVREEVLRLLRS